MPVDYQAIGAIIRRERERKGWSQGQLGRRIGGVTHATVSLVELGETSLPPHKLERYADVLGCSFAIHFAAPTDARAQLLARLANVIHVLDEDRLETLDALVGRWERAPEQGRSVLHRSPVGA